MSDIYTIAIDASTKSTGIAIFQNGQLKDYDCITQSSKDVLLRIKNMTDAVESIYKTYMNKGDVQIVMEQIIPDNLNDVKWAKNQNTFKALFYLQAAIALMFHHYSKEIEFIGASSWRKQCGIKQGGAMRDVLKMRDIQFVKDTYNITVNDDTADAICIGHAKVNSKPEPKPFNWE